MTGAQGSSGGETQVCPACNGTGSATNKPADPSPVRVIVDDTLPSAKDDAFKLGDVLDRRL
ncbi:hypothetical protein [Nonomuraea sp. NPDC048826]|uniref:hypothetical protein n=1 Tax=Nonomuraea sp. NPDC048826 TaxID=3364347 RepID=UPI00371ED8D5